MTTILYVIITAIILFVLYFFRTFNLSRLKILWQNAKANMQLKQKILESESKGEKPFYFKNGKVVVFAKTQLGAMLLYKNSPKSRKNASKPILKKV